MIDDAPSFTGHAIEKVDFDLNLKPSPMQIKVMESYLRHGSQKKVAHDLGISYQTVKNHMSNLYVRLGVSGAVEALHALGWVRAPSNAGSAVPCGWLAYCGRPEQHRGQHGGYRPFVNVSEEIYNDE